MIGYLKGTVIHKTATALMVLCGQVGYEVLVPTSRLMQYGMQQEVELYISHQQREDSVQLYGFDSWDEREYFLVLLNVSGIGPKGALAIIGQTGISGLYQAIASEDVTLLTKIPGIGKKTAQRMVLELHDKLPVTDWAEDMPVVKETVTVKSSVKDDITDVLLSLGYHEQEIKRIIPDLKAMGDLDEQTVIKRALQLLARF